MSNSNIIHREIIDLKGSPEQIRAFITAPERILDYYPGGIDGAVIEPGKSFYCHAKAGVSLLEVDQQQSNEQLIVLKVTTAASVRPPYTADRIRAAGFFTMIEDWQLDALGDGTRLTKTWRALEKHKYRWLPMGWIVRRSARAESGKLKAAWDRAADDENCAQLL